MKRTILLAVMCTILYAKKPHQGYHDLEYFETKRDLVSHFENTIKMYDVAVDPLRHLAYTAGSMTQWIAQIDLITGTQVGSVASPFERQILTLNVIPENGFLLICAPETSPVKQTLVNPETGKVLGSFTYSTNKGAVIADDRNRIYLSDGPTIYILDGNNLELISQFQPGGTQFKTGGLVIAGQTLYIGSRDLIRGKVKVLALELSQLNSPFKTFEFESGEPLGSFSFDFERELLIASGHTKVVWINPVNGSIQSTIYFSEPMSRHEYAEETGKLYSIVKNGWNEGDGINYYGQLYISDPWTGGQTHIRSGEYTHTLAIDHDIMKLVFPCMHSGYVDIRELSDPEHGIRVDIGNSIADLENDPEHDGVFIVERLGGSTVNRFNRDDGTYESFDAGIWPCAAEFEPETHTLFILNHAAATITADHPDHISAGNTITLQNVFPGKTDAIATMHLNEETHLLFACIPETERIAVIDTISEEWIDTFTIDGFHFDEKVHVALGNIQLASSTTHHLLYVLQSRERILQTYDTHTRELRESVPLDHIWPQDMGQFEVDLLSYDSVADIIWLGNRVLNPVSCLPTGDLVEKGARFLSYSENGMLCYFLRQNSETGMVVVLECDPDTFQILDERTLYPVEFGAPLFAYNKHLNHLWLGEFQFARIRCYDLSRKYPDYRVQKKN
jgi:regulator of extracellular matrix RemA (YlzA/DUF370 family)